MLKDMWQFKDTAAGKFLAVAMSVVLVVGMTNTNAFALDDETQEPEQQALEAQDVKDLTKVTFEIGEGATVKAAQADQQLQAVKDGEAVEAASHEAFKFTVEADEGFTLEGVSVNDKALDANENGAYEIAADQMVGEPLTVEVATAAAPAEDEAT